MLTKLFSATTRGIETHEVQVEVDLSLGLLQFFIVGLPDTAIKESRQRVQTALKNCGIKLPERKITVNLAPADLKKEGTTFDLPIAVGILQAAGLLNLDPNFVKETLFLAELSLDGTIKPIKGVLPIACDARKLGKKRLIVAYQNATEAGLIQGITVIGVRHLVELVHYLKGELEIQPTATDYRTFTSSNTSKKTNNQQLDLNQVKGQFAAKRALTIAAAGRHNLLFIGSPGSGKTMLAHRLATIMPPMTFDEIVETSKIYSISTKLQSPPLVINRPFRGPHHTTSQAGMIGGGSYPQPGEVSLAHNGILFLDELTEFKTDVLEVLRQPLEDKQVVISRAQQTLSFPASFLLICALNPCPCGFYGDAKRTCSCSQMVIKQYLRKLSGPLLDRIDIQVHVTSIDYETLKTNAQPQAIRDSATIREIVQTAVDTQKQRQGVNRPNSILLADDLQKVAQLAPEAEKLIKDAFDRLNMTMRGYHKILRIARTIADLEQSESVTVIHVAEALSYRSLDQALEGF